jgi:phosphotriesterase-related protein
MSAKGLAGKVQTVLGPVEGDSLGYTLSHEHLLNDHSPWFKMPELEIEKKQALQPLQLENLYLVRLNPFCNRDNLVMNDIDLLINEALIFKSLGGKTIVDCTTGSSIGRNPEGLAIIASQTGLNIIMGTGYYMAESHPPELAAMTEKQVADGLIRDITVGVDDTGIKAGFLGEIGCNTPLAESERKILRSCVAAQRETGVAISIHPGYSDEGGLEIVQVLKEAGADLSHVIIGHMDLFNYTNMTCRKIMDTGCNIAFDNIGHEGFYQIPLIARNFEMADINTVSNIVEMVKEGYSKQILVSHDIATKERLTQFGGTGYGHILRDVVPIMLAKGLSGEQIHTLLVENPKRVLTTG